MKKWQISKPKNVDWYLHFSKESYTTLKSVISSFKIGFQNHEQPDRKFLRPKNTSSTFLKFEPSRLGGPMLKNSEKYNKKSIWATYSGLILSAFRNQDVFIQQSDINWSRLLSRKADLRCQLLPSAPVTWSCQREGKALILKSLKIQYFLCPWNQILAYKTMLWMSVVRTLACCFHIL